VRAKGRSALVVAMIGVPMLGLAFADVAVRTGQLPPGVLATREIGAADALAELVSADPIVQHGRYDYATRAGDRGARRPERVPDVLALLPAGSRAATWRTYYAVGIGGGDRLALGEVEELDLTDPSARGLVLGKSGRLPRGPREAAVTARLAKDLGVHAGDSVTLRGVDGTFTVTGVVVTPTSLGATKAYVAPSAALPTRLGIGDIPTQRWAITLPDGERDVDLLPALNDVGIKVMPRTWYFDPPAATSRRPRRRSA
jgi:putative ABC transport system permease protein